MCYDIIVSGAVDHSYFTSKTKSENRCSSIFRLEGEGDHTYTTPKKSCKRPRGTPTGKTPQQQLKSSKAIHVSKKIFNLNYSKFAKDQHLSVLLQTIHLYNDLIIVYLSYWFVLYSLHLLYLIPLNQFLFITNTRK